VRRSHNLLILLTPGLLKRPWVLIEIVTATRADVQLVPVELQRIGMEFEYPDEAYYEALVGGGELEPSTFEILRSKGIDLDELCDSIRKVFQTIAMPFSPHKTAKIRNAELIDIIERCRIRTTSVDDQMDDGWVQRGSRTRSFGRERSTARYS